MLSLYVFSLSTLPCCSDDDCNDEIKTEHADNHSQDNKDNDYNTCSPFFTCGTCSGFVCARAEFDFKEVAFVKDKLVTVYKPHFLSDFFAKIWQPPRIS
ncbi:MAG: hypothetical protein AAGI07_09555 [Bacteroidota bacterium]